MQAVGRALGDDNPYAKAMLSEMERIIRRNKAVTFHDDLSPEMKPLLFTDFIKRVAHARPPIPRRGGLHHDGV